MQNPRPQGSQSGANTDTQQNNAVHSTSLQQTHSSTHTPLSKHVQPRGEAERRGGCTPSSSSRELLHTVQPPGRRPAPPLTAVTLATNIAWRYRSHHPARHATVCKASPVWRLRHAAGASPAQWRGDPRPSGSQGARRGGATPGASQHARVVRRAVAALVVHKMEGRLALLPAVVAQDGLRAAGGAASEAAPPRQRARRRSQRGRRRRQGTHGWSLRSVLAGDDAALCLRACTARRGGPGSTLGPAPCCAPGRRRAAQPCTLPYTCGAAGTAHLRSRTCPIPYPTPVARRGRAWRRAAYAGGSSAASRASSESSMRK